MKKYFIIFLAGIILYSCGPTRTIPAPAPAPAPPVKNEPKPAPAPPPPVSTLAPNTLSAAEKAAGWKLMFDGATTDGWHTYGSKTIGSAWKAVNGTLFLDAKNKRDAQSGGDIVSDEEFGNFELQLDWKLTKGGNSGVVIYSKEYRAKYEYMWSTGPEMQILDNDVHPDGKIRKHRTGDLYDMISSNSEPVKPTGEWNHVVITSLNGKLDFYLNGVHVINTTMWNDNWRNLIANSKFRDAPDFGTYRTGRIGLQDHGNNVYFKNIKIKRL